MWILLGAAIEFLRLFHLFLFLVGAFSLKLFSSLQSHSEWSTFFKQFFVHLFNQFSHKHEIVGSIIALNHKFFYASKSRGENQRVPLWFFSALCDFFSKNFEFYKRVPSFIF